MCIIFPLSNSTPFFESIRLMDHPIIPWFWCWMQIQRRMAEHHVPCEIFIGFDVFFLPWFPLKQSIECHMCCLNGLNLTLAFSSVDSPFFHFLWLKYLNSPCLMGTLPKENYLLSGVGTTPSTYCNSWRIAKWARTSSAARTQVARKFGTMRNVYP